MLFKKSRHFFMEKKCKSDQLKWIMASSSTNCIKHILNYIIIMKIPQSRVKRNKTKIILIVLYKVMNYFLAVKCAVSHLY